MPGLDMGGLALARIGGPVAAGQPFSLVSAVAPLAALLVLPTLWFAWAVDRRSPRLA